MSAENRAARQEALERVRASHRPVAAVIADLRRETGAEPSRDASPSPEPPEPPTAASEPEPESAPDATSAQEAAPDAWSEARRTVEEAWGAGRTARQRFGDPYCPAPVCYGHDYRVLDHDVVAAEGVPPYASDCNCTVIVD